MTCLIPKLFRDIATAPFSDSPKDNFKEAISTVALGALFAVCLYSIRKIPLAGISILAGIPIYIAAHYLDVPGKNCGLAMLSTFGAFQICYIINSFIRRRRSVPLLLVAGLVICVATSWYFFNQAGKKKSGYLRYRK